MAYLSRHWFRRPAIRSLCAHLPYVYVSDGILAPRGGEDLSSSLSRNYGGLAALAGVNLPSGSGGGVEIAKQAIFSSSFVKKYLIKDILVELMAV